MYTFILKKICNAFLVLLGVLSIIFFLFFVVLPADPARLSMGQRADVKAIDNIKKELYLDKPIYKQFLLYLNDLSPVAIYNNTTEEKEKYHYTVLCNISEQKAIVVKPPYLRRSYQSKKEVWKLLLQGFPGTMLLATLSIIIASIIGIFLGVIAALKKGSWMDTSILFTSILGISAPSFFAGILLAYFFGFLLHSYTHLSIVSPLWDYDVYNGKHIVLKSLVLPVLTLSIRPIAIIVQITRSSMLDVLSQDYIRTGYAKGLSKKVVLWRHALRNALNPIITSISGWFAELLAGSFFIEYIYGWKGIGKITVDALNKFDFPVVMGSVLFTATIFIIINVLVDVLYTIIDPRIKIT